MEQELFADLIQSLNEAVEYASGDNSKGRLTSITLSDEEIGIYQIVLRQLGKLSLENRMKVMRYADELLQASS